MDSADSTPSPAARRDLASAEGPRERWRAIDLATADESRRLLASCCGAMRWVDRMLLRRPFGSRDAVVAAAREEWLALSPDDWQAAFNHHPRIGDRAAFRGPLAAAGHIAQREQSGVHGASDEVLAALADANRAYEERFGYVFIVCATGKTAEEMLALLRARLTHDAQMELQIAAEEHAAICELRLLSA